MEEQPGKLIRVRPHHDHMGALPPHASTDSKRPAELNFQSTAQQ